MSSNNVVHVAVAVIKNEHGQYFIAKRHKNSHQGNLWEFPGGKVENNETVIDALERELFEEIGITLLQASPLIQIHHDYEDKSVLLDVWVVDMFDGKAFGKEGQKTCWVNQDDFSLYDFPAANLPILKAIELPDRYMITGIFKDEKELLWLQLAGEGQAIIAEARAYRTRIAESTKANAEYMQRILPEYRKRPKLVIQKIYQDAMEEVFDNADEKMIIQPSFGSKGKEIRVLLNRDPSIKAKPKEESK